MMEQIEPNSEIKDMILQKETVKLYKNVKSFTWEIKIFNNGDDDATIERLNKINMKLEEYYGVKE